MTRSLYEQKQADGRRSLLAAAIDVFAKRRVMAVHQLGSLARDDGDVLSDLDLWITFMDEALSDAVTQRDQVYAEIAEVLVKHEALQNRPLGGSYSLVIHRTDPGLVHVDYYFAPRSSSVILPEARLLYGDDSLPRGSWLLDQSAVTPPSLAERIDFLICMAFIGVKKVRRHDARFMSFLLSEYHRFVETYNLSLNVIEHDLRLTTLERLLHELLQVANERQCEAIVEIIHRYLPLGDRSNFK
jgi:predicted nucleotidyltransferase